MRSFQHTIKLSKSELSSLRRASIALDEPVARLIRRGALKLANSINEGGLNGRRSE